MLALAQKLLVKDKLTRAGRWAEKLDHIGMGLTGRTLGAIGIGNIGAEVFRLAAPFGMRHLAHDPYATPERARELGVELCDLDTLLRQSDFVSVMCPLEPRTRGMIGARELGLMKPSAYLINTARGPIVQEKALTEALVARQIAGAGLDVFEVEPTPADNPLLELDNVIVTPHGLCFTDECLTGLARSAFSAAAALARGTVPRYIVNPDALAHPAFAALQR
jgi:D-3-phosphoglycerate dehydrogenase